MAMAVRQKRRCAEKDCITLLSDRNPSKKCFVHDIDEDPQPGEYIGLTGLHYLGKRFTPADRRDNLDDQDPDVETLHLGKRGLTASHVYLCPRCPKTCRGVAGLSNHLSAAHGAVLKVVRL